MKFKVGDKVRCIREGGSFHFEIKNGEIYTVSGFAQDGELVQLKENSSKQGAWYPNRFELVEDVKEIKKEKDSGWGF